ncbi:MAG TPA: EAL domain-containing protein [Thermoanaerobaculia bacterium]|jgi:diguanylate cyclase (GGDEF)-like protein/PAS domain S-box-containing protein|nr:EAL domain-containing protein [Thermoanaerobaculia bacterium]
MAEQRTVSVLLIEDDPGDARLIRLLLSRARGCALEHVQRLAEGLERLAAGGIDVVLLDFSLPDSRGIESFRALRDAHPEVAVIVLTSLDDDDVALLAVTEGAQDYLVKRDVDTRLLPRAVRYAAERHRAELALRKSEERYALAVRGANDGLWDWDLERDNLFLSPRWKAMLGYEDGEVSDGLESWLGLVEDGDRDTLRSALATHFDGDAANFELEHRMRHKDGHQVWVLTRGVAVRDGKGRVVRMVGSQSDITARKLAEQQLVYDAFHDALTGLANRALLLDRMAVAMAAGRRGSGNPFALLFLDLDRFKTVNDSLGHVVGDRLLVAIARQLERLVRPGDTVARLGGDEFAVLVHNVRDAAAAVHVAERVQASLVAPFAIQGQEVFVNMSIGIALSGEAAPDPESMLRDADLAMYRAKDAGRGRYEVFDLELHRAALRLLKLETELRRAVAAGDFVMHYQPIIALDGGKIVGFEALVRWQHAERGLIPPARFIAVAEETGLIAPLGWFVLDQACAQAATWQRKFPAEPPLFMSVNVSGKLFKQATAVDQVLGILGRSQLPPESLRLEVTENVVLEHGETVMQRLLELRALGVQLSIDDFGTGYSSLSYLQRFRYDSLKIDRSFVSGIEGAGDSRTIVETILNLASHLGIGVVAEGVETAEQLSRLRQMGCALGQGFWFAQALDVPAAEELMASSPSW